MFKLTRNNKEFDIINTIKDNDIYNSDFIAKLDVIPHEYEYPYVYNKGRLDIVSNEIYQGKAYYSVPAVYNRVHLTPTTIITGMKFPSQDKIDNILNR